MLNPTQRNSLAITLRVFEERLRQAGGWIQGAEEAGILYRRALRLPPERKAAVRQAIDAALQEIATLSRKFDLVAVEQDSARTIAADMSAAWVHLCEMYSHKLKRYGEVDPRLTQTLDPHLDRLVELALSLAATFRE